MDIALDASAEQLIRDQLKTGRYAAPGDVVSAALRALSKVDAQDAALSDLRKKVAVGEKWEAQWPCPSCAPPCCSSFPQSILQPL